MIPKRCRRMAVALVVGVAGSLIPPPPTTRADDGESSRPPAMTIGHPTSRLDHAPRTLPTGSGAGSSGMWVGTVGLGLILATLGAVGYASKMIRPGVPPGLVRVIGRASLSPKHSVYVVKVGERVMVLGAGNQGAPTLLGELSDGDLPPHIMGRPNGANS